MKTIIKIGFIFLLTAMTNAYAQSWSLTHYKSYFNNNLKAWTQSFEHFNLSNFTRSDTIKFETIPYGNTNNLDKFYKLYKPALSFSPDDNQFIDIYSYWLNLTKENGKTMASFAVDQAITLCNLKTNKWTRIFFCGWSARIDEVLWITNTTFVLAGTTNNNNKLNPMVLTGNTVKRQFLMYNDTLDIMKEDGYRSSKLVNLNISNKE